MNRKSSFSRIAMLLGAGGLLVACDNTAMVGESDLPGSGGVPSSNGGSGIPLPLFVGGMIGTGGVGGMAGAGGVAGDTGGGSGAVLPIGTTCAPITFASGIVNPCGHAWAVAYSADGQWLATSGTWNGGDLHVWRTSDGTPVRTLVAHGATYGVDFSPDGKLLASAGQAVDGSGGMVKLWNVATGALVRSVPVTVPTGMPTYASGVAFSPDGSLLATSGNGPVELWRVADGSRVRSLAASNTVYQVRFSRDGSRVIAAGIDGGTARVWSASTGAVLLEGLVTAMDQASADFSPDGKLIASNGPGGNVHVWDAATGALLQTMGGHAVMMGRVVWVDQNRLLSNDWDGKVILWARDATGSFVTLHVWLAGGVGGGQGGATSLGMAVEPGGRRVVTGAQGGFVFFDLP